ncbi:MAG TPA: hypothetical protein VGB89_06555 [Bacteroidota bacterium]
MGVERISRSVLPNVTVLKGEWVLSLGDGNTKEQREEKALFHGRTPFGLLFAAGSFWMKKGNTLVHANRTTPNISKTNERLAFI